VAGSQPVAVAAPTLTPTPAPTPTASPSPLPTATTQALSCPAADAVARPSSLTVTPKAGKVTVVAIGSSSTFGYLASSPAAAYPAVLQTLLAARPDLAAYTVVNAGVNGDTLAGEQARLSSDVFARNPQVVILQVGTNDATTGQSDAALADYTTRLRATVEQVKAVAPVVLMNGQHYPAESGFYPRYQDATAQVAADENVALFDRYKLMKSFIDSGKYRYADILASDSFHPNDFTYRCMASVAADLILSRTKP
jgi:acyl-CoA thioesterase I